MSQLLNLFDVQTKKWENKKIKYICSLNKKVLSADTPSDFEFDYVDIGSVEYGKGITKKMTMFFEDSPSRARREVESGDVIVSTVRTYLKAITPITDENKNVIVSTGFAVIHPEKINKRFMSYVLISKPFVETIVSESVGVSYPAINPTKIAKIKIPFPQNETDQVALAHYLDKKTVNISLQIEKIQKMIELLKEKKEVLIINAVTKGLDPNVPMKDSGIDWIGEIPEHWEVKKIKNMFFVYNGATPKSDNDAYWDGDIIWVTPADYATSDTYISDSKRKITYEGLTSCATKIVPKNSIIVSNRAPIGAIALASKPLCTNQGCKTLVKKANAQIYEKYIYYYLSTQQDILNMLGKGTTFLELSSYDLSSFSIPFPQIEVQISISNYLDEKISYINGIISKNQKLIKKLTEYQEALITAAVTGKIDVRGE